MVDDVVSRHNRACRPSTTVAVDHIVAVAGAVGRFFYWRTTWIVTYSDQSMDVEVQLGACGHLGLRLTDIPLSKCHWESFVSRYSQLGQFGHHATVQRRCYTDWMDDV